MTQKVRSLLYVRFIYKAFEYVYECIITSHDIGQEIESLKKARGFSAGPITLVSTADEKFLSKSNT